MFCQNEDDNNGNNNGMVIGEITKHFYVVLCSNLRNHVCLSACQSSICTGM